LEPDDSSEAILKRLQALQRKRLRQVVVSLGLPLIVITFATWFAAAYYKDKERALETQKKALDTRQEELIAQAAEIKKLMAQLQMKSPEQSAHPVATTLLPITTAVSVKSEALSKGLGRYTFSLYIQGNPDSLKRIKSVQYDRNHPTFTQKTMSSDEQQGGFRVTWEGWGCLTSIIVTFIPTDTSEKPEKTVFDMCANLGW
jgi:hypothetical protein